MSQIIIAGVFKQKLCMGQMCSCSIFRAVTGAKRKMKSFAWPDSQTCFEKSSWLFPFRIRGLSVPVTQKPLKNDTAKFAKYFSWCSDRSAGENSPVSRRTPCRVVWDWHERAVSFSWMDVAVKLPTLCTGLFQTILAKYKAKEHPPSPSGCAQCWR